MTTEAPTKRHRWTKAELAHLNRSVSHAKNKAAAFQKIADEMGLTKTAVAGTYYNHQKDSAKGKKARKTLSEAVPAPKQQPSKASSPVQMGRPFDFAPYSERELFELQQAVTFEVNRRIEMLRELEQMFKG